MESITRKNWTKDRGGGSKSRFTGTFDLFPNTLSNRLLLLLQLLLLHVDVHKSTKMYRVKDRLKPWWQLAMHFYIQQKTLKCCCTSRVPNLFMLARMFRDFLHACVRNMHACVHNFPMNTQDTFVYTNVKYRTESPGQNSKITFFDWMTLTFDPWPMTNLIRIVDYTGKGVIHEAFLHKTSATDANVTRCGAFGHTKCATPRFNTKCATSRYIGISYWSVMQKGLMYNPSPSVVHNSH